MMSTAVAFPAVDDAALFADLVEQIAANGDRAAFSRLFAHFAPRVKGRLLQQGVEAAQADALTEDVMVAVWRHAASFDPRRTTVATWVFRIMRNRCVAAGVPERRPTPVAAIARTLSTGRLRLVAGAAPAR
jgi:DNA-directed RNA polymerase specialized sigma24 family protein